MLCCASGACASLLRKDAQDVEAVPRPVSNELDMLTRQALVESWLRFHLIGDYALPFKDPGLLHLHSYRALCSRNLDWHAG